MLSDTLINHEQQSADHSTIMWHKNHMNINISLLKLVINDLKWLDYLNMKCMQKNDSLCKIKYLIFYMFNLIICIYCR